MIDCQQLIQMSHQNMEEVKKENLVDISTVKINDTLPPKEKVVSFLEQIKNPYCFLCGKTPVHICFSDGAPSLDKLLAIYFIHLKQG